MVFCSTSSRSTSLAPLLLWFCLLSSARFFIIATCRSLGVRPGIMSGCSGIARLRSRMLATSLLFVLPSFC
uniref:Putative secreted peptide n=1 Tax=Anopheles braziliensis TaxID=58242 RepID=A0A2M3ZSK4_9DIPT